MEFFPAVKSAYAHYATFEGRASRSEFWWFALFNLIATMLLGFVDDVIGTYPLLYGLFSLASLLPSLALGVRRLHDINKSGWYYLLICIPLIGVIVLFVWSCLKGTPDANRFGDNPLTA